MSKCIIHSLGIVIGKGYKTTESVEVILDHRMFERKIVYLEEMIMSNEILDKKCVLDYIVDALQYLISVQKADAIDKKICSSSQGSMLKSRCFPLKQI
ncbi:MAG: hypothetical protein HDT39_03095 [Lachnospiraceae bacterium]|nr:hypothetical protein [Lachnospiraceae bacterium]